MRRAEPPDLGTDRGDRPSIGDRSSASVQAAQLRPSDGAYLSVVVPVWNGAARLSRTLYALHGLLLRQGYPTELIIVDDCSGGDVMKAIASFEEDVRSEQAAVRVLRNARNRGKGFSVARGMLAATGALRVFTDADLAYPAEYNPVRSIRLLAANSN